MALPQKPYLAVVRPRRGGCSSWGRRWVRAARYARTKSCLTDDVKNAGVANDDADTWDDKGDEEEELLGGVALGIGKNGTGADARIKSEPSPLLKPSGDEGPEAANPCRSHH